VFFLNPKPTAGVFIVNDGKVLLAKRGIEPFKDWWDSIGGFVEEDESPQEAAIRETREETGLEIKIIEVIGTGKAMYNDQSINPIAFLAEIISGTPKATDDVSELKWFDLKSLPDNIAFEGNRKVLDSLRQRFGLD
jgi:ADP-ribose pyrophosphatase YjhB (NUDIX family)